MITRPTNKAGQEVLSMPTEKSPPETQPDNLSLLFNAIWDSITHLHNNGTITAPAYLKAGGLWACPERTGTKTLVRASATNDLKLFYNDENGVEFPFGYTAQLIVAPSDLNQLRSEGLYRFTNTASNVPVEANSGFLWVMRTPTGTYTQLILSDASMILTRTATTQNSIVTWGAWKAISGGTDDAVINELFGLINTNTQNISALTTRTINTTAPLSGGGNLSANRTLTISAATAATASADGSAGSALYAADSDKTSRNKAATPAGVAAQITAAGTGTGVPTSRTISTTLPLTGGGDLSANRTLAITSASAATASIDGSMGIVAFAADSETSSRQKAATPAGVAAQISKAVAAYVPTYRMMSTTAPLSGGGTLSADRTLAVSTGTTSAVGVLQLATTTEAATGTDTAKAVTAAGVAAHVTSKTSTLATQASLNITNTNVTNLTTRVTALENSLGSISTALTAIIGETI